MSFKFIMGKAGAGKTSYIYDEIIKRAMEEEDKTFMIIVPEQFTMQTQKDIVTRHPNKGILNIEVLSFGRLAFRIFEEVGLPKEKSLDDMGKSLVLRKVMNGEQQSLTYFNKMADKVGFIDGLKTLITEFYQYQYSLEDIQTLRESLVDQPILNEKLSDVWHIFNSFKEYIQHNYITTEETLDILGRKLEGSKLLKGAILIFDGFYGYTPQQYTVIRQLSHYVEDFYFGITLAEKEDLEKPLDQDDLFYESKKAYRSLMHIATEQELKVDKNVWVKKETDAKDIGHLVTQIFRYPYESYQEDAQHIQVTATVNPEQEVEYLCRQIHHLVAEQGYDYRDIAVLTGDLERYQYFIKRYFSMYEIPCFIDTKKKVYQHPAVELLRSALDIFVSNWSYESVFRFLKVGWTPIEVEEVDRLENFVLKFDIKGRKEWVEDNWLEKYAGKRTLSEYALRQLELVEDARNEVVKCLDILLKGMATKKKTVKGLTTSLYEFLVDCRVPHRIMDMSREFERESMMLLKREYDQIWKLLVELFDKMVEILGEEDVTIKDYAKLVEAGIEQCEFGLVPPSLNQIVVGDLERSRLHSVRALFVLGFNDGLIPSIRKEQGVFTDEEREHINTIGKEIADSNKRKVYAENFLVYNALSKPADKLYLTYSLASMEGQPERPSFLLKQIGKILPGLEEEYVDPKKCGEDYITLPMPTLRHLIKEKRKSLDDERIDAIWKHLEDWYLDNDQWRTRVGHIFKGFLHNNQEKSLSEESVDKLYGKVLKSSISQLESYASCPFSYYIRYGLQAKEREYSEIKAPEVGVFFHLILESFARKLSRKGMNWAEISEQDKQRLIDNTLDEVTPLMQYSAFLKSSRNKYFQYRLVKITKRAIDVLGKHLQRGDFLPKDFELGFGEKDKLPAIKIEIDPEKHMELTGKIDRVDLLEQTEDHLVKVIDYKSGNQGFDMVAIYNGLQLQLIVYLDALIEVGDSYYGKPLRPAGIFYFKVDDPLLTVDKEFSKEQLEEMLLGQFKLSGIVLSDPDVVKSLDNEIEASSSIIPVRLTKSGGFHKSHSSVATEEHFELLRQFAKKKAKSLGENILKGKIPIEPYKLKEQTGCDYCPYKAICQFDLKLEGNVYNVMETIKKDCFFDLLKEEVEEK